MASKLDDAELDYIADDISSNCSSSDFDENPTKEFAVEIRKLYVGRLNARTSTSDVYSFFSKFGKVQNAHFARSKDGTRGHYGFVTFFKPDDARKALDASRLHGLNLNGSCLVVNNAEKRHQPRKLRNGRIIWTKKRRQASSNVMETEGDSLTAPSGSGMSNVRGHKTKRLRPKEDANIDESKCFMHLLNSDCLMHIFSFLPKTDLIKSERVCKRWQSLCMQMWLTTKHLEFTWMTHITKYRSQILTVERFTQLLVRCGPNLASLDVAYRLCRLNTKAVNVIVEECPNLQSINLSRFPLPPKSLKILSRIGANLRRVVFEDCVDLKDNSLKTFLQACPLLTSAVLSRNPSLTGECLKGLNSETIEELILDNCSSFRSKVVIAAFRSFKNLQRLSLNSCINLTSGVLTEMFMAIPQLQSLSMCLHYPSLTGSALSSISNLTDLVTLTLHQNPSVNDIVMRAISKNCKKLVWLDITGCSVHTIEPTLTDAGIKCIAQLPKLTHLKMSYMATVSNDALEALAEKGRLKTLECRGCPTFTDFGCSRLISLCNELELFDLSGCNFISINTVNAAIDSVKLRTNNVKLKLIIGGTAVCSIEPITEPLLELDLADLCVEQFRPDYVDDEYFLSSDADDEDDIDHFDWECQSMFFGDDLGEWFLANIENGFVDSDDEEYDGFQLF